MELSQVNFVPRDGTKLEAADGSFKKTYTIPPKGIFDLPPWLSQKCYHAVFFPFPLKVQAHRMRDSTTRRDFFIFTDR
jgi:hypothetical protein